MKFDEVFEMIKMVVKFWLIDGYIVDSFGWVYYCLGWYEEVVIELECVIELWLVDLVINDYLGDVYWKVGC